MKIDGGGKEKTEPKYVLAIVNIIGNPPKVCDMCYQSVRVVEFLKIGKKGRNTSGLG